MALDWSSDESTPQPMFDTFFEQYPEYKVTQKPTAETLSKYRDKVPEQLIEFWNAYGFGTFMNGYLKVVEPSEFQQVFNEAYNNTENEIVFAVTALGDFLTWTGDAIRAVYFKNGYDSIIESGDDMDWFFNMDLADKGFLSDNLNDQNYRAAKTSLGEPEYDECFGFMPLLGSGGTEKSENLQRVKIKEHISLIAKAMGKIQ